MSTAPGYSRLEVPTATGQQLVLAHDARYDEFRLSVYARTRTPGAKAARIAFMLGDDHSRPRVTPPDPAYGEAHHTLWVGRACVDVTEATANTARAWIDSRPRLGAQPLPATLPRDIAAPVAAGAVA